MSDLRLGALCWNQYTDWPSLLAAGIRAEELGFESLWTWDHLYPIVGSSDGPIHEGWLTLAAWAQATKRIRIGLMVGANTFREPSLTAKMATTLDHISGGRATLGIGGAWFEEEHEAYGLAFGDGFPERLRWLAEALPIMRGMLRNDRPTAKGIHYKAKAVRNNPPPIQKRLPLLIGGGGEQVTLKLVAKYADANNVGGGIEKVRHKEEVLLRHCQAVGRDPKEIERTSGIGVVVIRDSRAEARKVADAIFEGNGKAEPWKDQPVGTPEDVVAFIAPYLEIGYQHLIAGFPNPYDEESMTRLATEVRAAVDAKA
ncbi:MAG: TIGR03560 family F420-dependent LLM class oxidoreductase [Chloroflexi bacterium]|nr:TIGR03560 family F420-dependent LLM class oxidoreductase [Chloroflexota bacterium]